MGWIPTTRARFTMKASSPPNARGDPVAAFGVDVSNDAIGALDSPLGSAVPLEDRLEFLCDSLFRCGAKHCSGEDKAGQLPLLGLRRQALKCLSPATFMQSIPVGLPRVLG